MRILHVLGKLDRGGAETSLVRILRHIDRSKYQFDFLVHTEMPGAYDDEVKALGARIIPCLSPSNPFRYARNFFRIVREYGPYDCVHSHVTRFSGYVLALARASGIQKRIVHSRTDNRAVENDAGFGRRAYVLLMNGLLKLNATKGLAVSNSAAESLFGTDWTLDDRWQVCYSGIDLEPFSSEVDRETIRAGLQIPSESLVVGHVGRFATEKNHSFILDIARKICPKRPDIFFLFVGDGHLRGEIERKAEEYGISRQMRFTGGRSDTAQLMMAGMDLFLLPSRHEGFPVVLMEAQAAGLPCFVSDVVTTETNIVPGLVHRLPIDAGADVWADSVMNNAVLERCKPSPGAMQEFSIQAATRRLCAFYGE